MARSHSLVAGGWLLAVILVLCGMGRRDHQFAAAQPGDLSAEEPCVGGFRYIRARDVNANQTRALQCPFVYSIWYRQTNPDIDIPVVNGERAHPPD